MELPQRIVAILSLIQAFFILGSYFLCRIFLGMFDQIMLQMWGRPHPPPQLPDFVRYWGAWFLIVPLLWFAFSVMSSRWKEDKSSVTSVQFLAGLILTVAIAVVFSAAAIRAVLTMQG